MTQEDGRVMGVRSQETHLPVNPDLNAGTPTWGKLLKAGRLFPTTYETHYWEALERTGQPGRTDDILGLRGFSIEAISADGQYYQVQRPQNYKYRDLGGSYRFFVGPEGVAEHLTFNTSGNGVMEPHRFYSPMPAAEMFDRLR